MIHLKLFESFEITEPILYGNPLNNKEINILKGYNVMYPEWILKDDNYYYIFDHRCENIKDVPVTYINAVCKKFEISNYTINDDYSIDVLGNVSISDKKLTKIPLKFNKVSGYFTCDTNQLTTLLGSPKSVGKSFGCYSNELTTLEGSPESVGGIFDCAHNKLTTLEGGPKEVGRNFNCSDNKLTTLEGSPEYVGGYFNCAGNKLTTLLGSPKKVGGDFECRDNQLTTLEGAPESVGGDFYCSYFPQLTSLEYKGIKGKNI